MQNNSQFRLEYVSFISVISKPKAMSVDTLLFTAEIAAYCWV